MRSIRQGLTYANVMSTLAVFLVLGGGAAFAASHLAKNSVGAKQLKKNAVTTAKIKNGAVSTAKVASGAVGTDLLATGAVTADKLANGIVTNGKLANNSVTTAKLSDGNVTSGKLANGAVTTGKLGDDAATGPKVKESSLHFTCNFPVGTPAFQLPGGGLCAFTSGGAATWATSINVCRGAATGGTLPTVAEFAAIAAVTGSPFRSISAWASDVVAIDGGGAITSVSTVDLTLSPTTTTACVYDPALAPAPGS